MPRRRSVSSLSSRSSQSSLSVESPTTGRWIVVGGPAYRDLIRMGYTDAQLRRGGMSRRPRPRRRHGARSGFARPTRAQRRMSVSDRGRNRGSRTRGWSKVAPRRGKPRKALKKKCGDKCFLDPKHDAFPICAKLSRSSSSCEIDCRGVQAAKIRAAQWGYTNVKKAADELYRTKCK
uniref:Uncharacterized protein n=1 Tax=viral metagenome TaxID=1070528 RepID=A0A6C0BNQ5_9ZZZZ